MYGGADIIIKVGIRCEEMMCKMGEVYFLYKNGRNNNKFEWMVGSMYMNCEGVGK